jgi:hypothetical protein
MIFSLVLTFLFAFLVSTATFIWRASVAVYESGSQVSDIFVSYKWEGAVALTLFLGGIAVVQYQPYVMTGLDGLYECLIWRFAQIIFNFAIYPVKVGFYEVTYRINDIFLYYRNNIVEAVNEIQALGSITNIQQVTEIINIVYSMLVSFSRALVNIPSLRIKYFTDVARVFFNTMECFTDIVESIIVQLAQFTIISQDCDFCSYAALVAPNTCTILSFAVPGVTIDCSPETCYKLSTDLMLCLANFLDFITGGPGPLTNIIFALADALDCILRLWKLPFFILQGIIDGIVNPSKGCVQADNIVPLLVDWATTILNCFNQFINTVSDGAVDDFFYFLFQYLLQIAYLVVNGAELTIACFEDQAIANCFNNYPLGTGLGSCQLDSNGNVVDGSFQCINLLNNCLEPIPLYAPLLNVGPPNVFDIVETLFQALDLVVCSTTTVIGCFLNAPSCGGNVVECINVAIQTLQCVETEVPPLTSFMNLIIQVLQLLNSVIETFTQAIDDVNNALQQIANIIPFKRNQPETYTKQQLLSSNIESLKLTNAYITVNKQSDYKTQLKGARDLWKQYLSLKKTKAEGKCAILINSCSPYELYMDRSNLTPDESRHYTDYLLCLIHASPNVYMNYVKEYGYGLDMYSFYNQAKIHYSNFTVCVPSNIKSESNELMVVKREEIDYKQNGTTMLKVFKKAWDGIKKTEYIQKLSLFFEEIAIAKKYYNKIYPNSTLAEKSYKEYVEYGFNDTSTRLLKYYLTNMKINRTLPYDSQKHKRSPDDWLPKRFIDNVREELGDNDHIPFLNKTYHYLKGAYDIEHWKSVQLFHMLIYCIDNSEQSQLLKWSLGLKYFLIEKGFVEKDEYDSVMEKREYFKRGSIAATTFHIVNPNTNFSRVPMIYGPFLIPINISTYFPPLYQFSPVLEKAMNMSIDIRKAQDDNYNFDQVVYDALSWVLNTILGIFISIGLDIWGGVTNLINDLANVNYQQLFYQNIGNFLVTYTSCNYPYNIDGTTIYNPFCAFLVPEGLFNWIEVPPNAVFAPQIQWPVELITFNCTSIYNGQPFIPNFDFELSDNCGIDSQPRPLCPLCDYCQREYGNSCTSLDFGDSLSSFLFMIGAFSKSLNLFVNGGVSLQFFWFFATGATAIATTILAFYLLPVTLVAVQFIMWGIAVFYTDVAFGLILLILFIVLTILVPGILGALPLVTVTVVIALVIWGISLFYPFVANFSIMPTLLTVFNFVNSSFLFFWVPNLDPIIARMERFNYVPNQVPEVDTFCFFFTFSNFGLMYLNTYLVGFAAVVSTRVIFVFFIYIGDLLTLIFALYRGIQSDESYQYDLQSKLNFEKIKKKFKSLKKDINTKLGIPEKPKSVKIDMPFESNTRRTFEPFADGMFYLPEEPSIPYIFNRNVTNFDSKSE